MGTTPRASRAPTHRGRAPLRDESCRCPGLATQQKQSAVTGTRIIEAGAELRYLARSADEPSPSQASRWGSRSCTRCLWLSSRLLRSSQGLLTHIGDESVTLGRNGDYESRSIRVVAQRPPNFPYRGINAGIAVQENTLSPDSLYDLVARHQLTASFRQQEEQIERDALEMYDPAAAPDVVGTP